MTPPVFWTDATQDLFAQLHSRSAGLTEEEAALRMRSEARPPWPERLRSSNVWLFLRQFLTPGVLLLLVAAALSLSMHATSDGSLIIGIIVASGALSYGQERGAKHTVAELLARVQVRATVLRDGTRFEVAPTTVVPGDILLLEAGDQVAADARVLECNALCMDEALITGESFPVEKQVGALPADTPLPQRSNVVLRGTHVVSGTGMVLVVRTGADTEFGKIAHALRNRVPETSFERGIRGFGTMLLELTLVLALVIFAANVFLRRPVLESFMFANALAVGLTPQLLPAIISINLAQGARRMAKRRAIVKRLASLEDFGSMGVLCVDKTGTLTEGKVRIQGSWDPLGVPSPRPLELARINALHSASASNPIDVALREPAADFPSASRCGTKRGELPYDFTRRCTTVAIDHQDGTTLILKGAFSAVLDRCSQVLLGGELHALEAHRAQLEEHAQRAAALGYRTLGVAERSGSPGPLRPADETQFNFVGFITLFDPPKADAGTTVARLGSLGVQVKVLTGDAAPVAQRVAQAVGLEHRALLTGKQLQSVSPDALAHVVLETAVFAEMEPRHKERVVLALKQQAIAVGFLGDGINDAPALHAADVGISVDTAADVAKEAADVVLLEKDLSVLADGIVEGRRTFANTLKYVFMATSANFGNMFSMAGASLFLPFLPLLPQQVLLTNVLTDLPEMAIATDRVDEAWTLVPLHWDLRSVRRFMVVFGLLSSFFDLVTFLTLRRLLHADAQSFRTGWLVESVASAAMVVLVIRTRGTPWRSRPSPALLSATLAVIAVTSTLPLMPWGHVFGLGPLPPVFYLALGGILLAYMVSAETAKRLFYHRALRPPREVRRPKPSKVG